jgi:hypothetical protein
MNTPDELYCKHGNWIDDCERCMRERKLGMPREQAREGAYDAGSDFAAGLCSDRKDATRHELLMQIQSACFDLVASAAVEYNLDADSLADYAFEGATAYLDKDGRD